MIQTPPLPGLAKEHRKALFSACRKYRYLLEIIWDDSGKPLLQVIGLNPSTADEVQDDPTIRRCKRFAKDWGYGGLLMTNLFAFRATDPKVMLKHSLPDWELLENMEAISDANRRARLCLAAWGCHGGHLERNLDVTDLIPNLCCLGKTKKGHPKHPLYVPANTKAIPL